MGACAHYGTRAFLCVFAPTQSGSQRIPCETRQGDEDPSHGRPDARGLGDQFLGSSGLGRDAKCDEIFSNILVCPDGVGWLINYLGWLGWGVLGCRLSDFTVLRGCGAQVGVRESLHFKQKSRGWIFLLKWSHVLRLINTQQALREQWPQPTRRANLHPQLRPIPAVARNACPAIGKRFRPYIRFRFVVATLGSLVWWMYVRSCTNVSCVASCTWAERCIGLKLWLADL